MRVLLWSIERNGCSYAIALRIWSVYCFTEQLIVTPDNSALLSIAKWHASHNTCGLKALTRCRIHWSLGVTPSLFMSGLMTTGENNYLVRIWQLTSGVPCPARIVVTSGARRLIGWIGWCASRWLVSSHGNLFVRGAFKTGATLLTPPGTYWYPQPYSIYVRNFVRRQQTPWEWQIGQWYGHTFV